MPKKKKPRVVLRKKVSVGLPMTLVDRPSTPSLTNPRAVERYLDAMTLQHALMTNDFAMHGQQSRNPEKAPCHLFAPAARQVGERAACAAARVHIGNPG